MNLDKLALPQDFEEKLPELKQRTLKWQTVYNSGTDINSSATISFYEQTNGAPIGNLVLLPALAANTNIDPLMKSVIYWGLTHKYNITCIDTFLSDFETEIGPNNIKQFTYSEFKGLVHQSFKFITPYIIKNTCVIAHCIGSVGITGVFNDCVTNGEKIPVQSAIFFAPWPKTSNQRFNALKTLQKRMEKHPENLVDAKIQKKFQHIKFTSTLQELGLMASDVKFEPEIINQWKIPVTYIAAGHDNIAPASRIAENFNVLHNMSNGKYFKYIYLPNANHTFHVSPNDTKTIISIIKSSRVR